MNTDNINRLGIIAGGGQYPFLLARAARQKGIFVSVVGFKPDTEDELVKEADAFCWLRLGQLGRLIRFFKQKQVQGLVMAGTINKPRALDLRPDWRAARLLLRLKQQGDNVLLTALVAELEKEGLPIVSGLDFLPQLQMPSGILSLRSPKDREIMDIRFGWPLLQELGRLDVGQCLAVKQKMVVAVEGIEGTDAMILRAGELAGPGCVILKCCKPGQEERVDLPSIGLKTIESMQQAKASCLAIQAGKSLFFDSGQALELAGQAGICVVGIEAGHIGSDFFMTRPDS